jgi:superfamily II DNA/RNA helicase
MLFSATLDQIHGLIAQTKDPITHDVVDEIPTVEGVEHHFFLVHPMDKIEVLCGILEAPRGLTLVFTRTKRMCDRLGTELQAKGVKATAIHGDLRQQAREKALTHFEAGGADVLVATDVAARGLDIDNITQVVNYDPPEDHKAYLHRIGRTARAGRTGVGITLAVHDEREAVYRIARALRLETAVEEIFSTDPRLRQVGTGELEGSPTSEAPVTQGPSGDTYARFKRRRGARSRR